MSTADEVIAGTEAATIAEADSIDTNFFIFSPLSLLILKR
jgi:hypothetical protein